LAVLVHQPVDALLVAGGAQGGGDQGLRLAALEDGRAVRPRQVAHLAPDGPHLLEPPAVDALALEDQVAHDPLLQGREGRRCLSPRPACARSSSIISTTTARCCWANWIACSMRSSLISRAKPSIMVTAERVPATTRSSSLSSSWEWVGIRTQSPPTRPTRTAP